jgi:phosphoglycolate phosphatase-like HAD superfamily hydrolase
MVRAMRVECVVLDLDGTFTDLSREAPAFSSAFAGLAADLLGRELDPIWVEAERTVRARAPELAWTIDGHAVAPADADPYILASCVAHLVFDELGVLTREPALRAEIISTLFRRAYRHTGAAFRPDAARLLDTLLARGLPVCFVTNAPAEVAEAKLDTLALADRARLMIRGDACKFLIGPPSRPDARMDRLPTEKRLPGLARPLLLQRGRYFDALAAIWETTGARPETTLVCGDIFELDLALPAELGAQVHFIKRPRTHAYELDALAALGDRGGVSEGLAAVLERVTG